MLNSAQNRSRSKCTTRSYTRDLSLSITRASDFRNVDFGAALAQFVPSRAVNSHTAHCDDVNPVFNL